MINVCDNDGVTAQSQQKRNENRAFIGSSGALEAAAEDRQ